MINLLFKYIYLLFFAIAVILIILLLIINNKSAKKVRRKKINTSKLKEKINDFVEIVLNKNILINLTVKKISDSVQVATGLNHLVCNIITIGLIFLYFAMAVYVFNLFIPFALFWYTKVLVLIISFLVPGIFYSIGKNFLNNKLLNQLPAAFAEISSAYRSKQKIKDAIEMAVPYMPKEIQREFLRFKNYIQSDMTFNEGLIYLKKRINDPYIKTFCFILQTGRDKNSNISNSLDALSIKTRDNMFYREKSKNKIVFYKILDIGTIFAIPVVMNFSKLFAEEAYMYYYSFGGSMLLVTTMLVILMVYIILDAIEKNV